MSLFTDGIILDAIFLTGVFLGALWGYFRFERED